MLEFHVKHLVSFLVLLFLTSFAHAEDKTITCTGPTKYTDGTSIPAGTVITYSIYGGLRGETKLKRDTSPTCRFIRPNLTPGIQEWYVTATAGGLESPPSEIVSAVITAPVADRDGDAVPDATDACPDTKGTLPNGCNPSPPTPPVNVLVTTQTAYEYRDSTKTMAAIGLVPEATTCGPETLLLKSVTYCRVKLADSLPVVWPTNRSLREVWVVKPVG